MTHRDLPITRLILLGALSLIVLLLLLLLPRSAAFAAPASAIYLGDAPAASGPGRHIELRLRADGTMTWLTDYRNNRAPIIEEGRWHPLSVEDIDVIIERKDGHAIGPNTVRFTRQGDTLRTGPESSAEFGSQGLQLRQAKSGVPATAAAPAIAGATPVGVWRWESLIAASEKVAVDQPERYTLEIQPGGKALVRADCNRGPASYKLDGRAITIKVTGITRAACPSGSLSGRYLKGLEAAVGQRIRGDNLFLDLPAEGGTMKFVRAR